jgi:hypothetical protein
MSLLITAGIVATGLGAFIAGLVVAALGAYTLFRRARHRLRGRSRAEPAPRASAQRPAPRWATAWRRWAPAGATLSALTARVVPGRTRADPGGFTGLRSGAPK